MNTGRLRRMDPERRRRLVEVSAVEFGSAGYENASLNHIVDACGMSKSSFYYVLPSKAHLFEFVVSELLDAVASTITIPKPEEFAGRAFWPRLERFFADLVVAAQTHESFLTLGRMFYSQSPPAEQGTVSETLTTVRTWVEELLLVGRASGSVYDDLPQALQVSLAFGVIAVFDEWTMTHYDEIPPTEVGALAAAQFATIRRMLEPSPAQTRRRPSAE
ncbi:TetR/AcrR family transcriptional regulator [Mycobacterium sp. NPDC051804]|uniref:TetR/AcrR family transcriptional regulator n=1 Tax=Mycobacterium sp. NPDC051804 TaxID=3364295 RepID=UPI0037B77616